jgi:hypothetical protein
LPDELDEPIECRCLRLADSVDKSRADRQVSN